MRFLCWLSQLSTNDLGIEDVGISQLSFQYHFSKYLGSGATSHVHQIEDAQKVQFVFKFFKQQYSNMLAHELNILTTLSQLPFVPKIAFSGTNFFIMTPVCTMLHIGMETAELRQLYRDVSSVLQGCRELNIVHRDVRPSNIGMSASRFYLLDWGYSRTISGPFPKEPFVGDLRFVDSATLIEVIDHAQSKGIPTALATTISPDRDCESLKKTCYYLKDPQKAVQLNSLVTKAAIFQFWTENRQAMNDLAASLA
jgi:serine/threonine protein kinase